MGLGLLIVVMKSLALRKDSAAWDRAAKFWGRIFGINFVFGVVTRHSCMEFQFGTNWAQFSQNWRVISSRWLVEGVFSFFLESAFLGLFLYVAANFTRSACTGSPR